MGFGCPTRSSSALLSPFFAEGCPTKICSTEKSRVPTYPNLSNQEDLAHRNRNQTAWGPPLRSQWDLRTSWLEATNGAEPGGENGWISVAVSKAHGRRVNTVWGDPILALVNSPPILEPILVGIESDVHWGYEMLANGQMSHMGLGWKCGPVIQVRTLSHQ